MDFSFTKSLLGLFKEVAHAWGADAREDLHEFGGRDAEERDTGLRKGQNKRLYDWIL